MRKVIFVLALVTSGCRRDRATDLGTATIDMPPVCSRPASSAPRVAVSKVEVPGTYEVCVRASAGRLCLLPDGGELDCVTHAGGAVCVHARCPTGAEVLDVDVTLEDEAGNVARDYRSGIRCVALPVQL